MSSSENVTKIANVYHIIIVHGQDVSGQNVSATKLIGTNVSAQNVLYHLHNVLATKRIVNKTYWQTKRTGYKTYRRHNASSTKQIGGQNVSADKNVSANQKIVKSCLKSDL